MDLKPLLDKIDNLTEEEQMKIYSHLVSKLRKRSQTLQLLAKIRGRAVWGMDAQEYINRLRDNDRF